MTTQIAMPVEIRPEDIERKQSLGAAIELCAELGGYRLDKELQLELDCDKAQFSRWLSGTEGIIWPKFMKLLDVCGNDAPLMWMLYQRGYDLRSLRKRESETEKQLRLAHEALGEERRAREALEHSMRRILTGAQQEGGAV